MIFHVYVLFFRFSGNSVEIQKIKTEINWLFIKHKEYRNKCKGLQMIYLLNENALAVWL